MSERRYSESELREVLRLASEEQNKNSSPIHDLDGYSQQDIERAAAEVGIDPLNVRAALNNVKSKPLSKPTSKWSKFSEASLLDNSKDLSVTRTFHGQMDDGTWQEMLSELRKIFRSSGTSNFSGSTREWSCNIGAISANASSVQKNDSTRIRVEFGVTAMFEGLATSVVSMGIAFPLVLGILGIWLTSRMNSPSAFPIGITLVLMVLILSFGVFIRHSMRHATQKVKAKVEALMDVTQELLQEESRSSSKNEDQEVQTQSKPLTVDLGKSKDGI